MLKTAFAKIVTLSLSTLLCSGLLSCKNEEKLPSLEDRLAGAVDLVTSPSGNYFYVLNSDYERRYNKGSILIVSADNPSGTQKIKAISTKRMGSSLSIAQNMMVITYADPEGNSQGTVEVWDIADELNPKLLSSIAISCVPINGIIAPTTPYFAVSCRDGWIYVGKNPKNTAEEPTTVDLVRYYEYDKRAVYFYENAGKTYLLGFPTDLDNLDSADANLYDQKKYDIATDAMIDGPNGVPDIYEETETARRRTRLAAPYQMFIYPVSDEEAASKEPQDPGVPAFHTFRYLARGTYLKPSLADKELHFIHFTLLEANGQPSAAENITIPNFYRYRTNFWDAKIGPENNPSIFYISQRGDYNSESNNVIRLLINPAAFADPNAAKFEDIFTANRVYGFAIDRDNGARYPGDFEFATIGGEPMLFVNSFRDLIYFSSAPFYSVTRKLLEAPASTQEVPSSFDTNAFQASFYQLAVSKSGKVLTSSFYGNTLYLFDGSPSVSIKDQTPAVIE